MSHDATKLILTLILEASLNSLPRLKPNISIEDAPDQDLAHVPGPQDAGGPGPVVDHVTDADLGLGPDLGTVPLDLLNDPGLL